MQSDLVVILTTKGEVGKVVKVTGSKIHYQTYKLGTISQKSQPSSQYIEVPATLYISPDTLEDWMNLED